MAVRSPLWPMIEFAPLQAATWVRGALDQTGKTAAGLLGSGSWLEVVPVADPVKAMTVAA